MWETFRASPVGRCLLPALLAGLLAVSGAAHAQFQRDLSVRILPDVGQRAPTTSWTEFQIKADIAYLLRPSTAEILRYDLVNQSWLPALALAEEPTALVVGASQLYVAFDRKIERFSLQGTNKTHVANTPDRVEDLFLDGNLLIANRSDYLYARFSSYNTVTNALLDTHDDYPHSVFGASHSVVSNRIFGRTVGISPADIDVVSYDDAGNFIRQFDSPYHGDYPYALRTWSWPDGRKVIDDSGTVYVGADLTYAGTLPTGITDVAFHGADVPIVLRGERVYAYNQALLETGRATLARPGRSLTVRAGIVFVFSDDESSGNGVGVETMPLASLSPVAPGTPVSPVGLDYDITSSAVDNAGIIYLLSKPHSSIFRWDVVTQKYLSTIPLAEAGDSLVFSASHNALFMLGIDRTIYKIALGTPAPVATAFVTAPMLANEMIPLGMDLLVLGNGSWDSQWVYSQNGTLLSSHFTCCYGRFHFYDAPRSRLFVDGGHLVYLGNGQFSGSAPYSSEFDPIGLSPDGQRILSREGVLYRAVPLQLLDYLSNDVTAVQWGASQRMFTVEYFGYGVYPTANVQRWSPQLTIERELSLAGEHHALYKVDNWLVEVTSAEAPRFYVLDAELDIVAPAVLDVPVVSLLAANPVAVGLRWDGVQGALGYEVQRRLVGSADWVNIGAAGASQEEYLDTGAHGGRHLEYRVRARNGGNVSAWSNAVAADLTTSAPGVPVDPNAVAFTIDDAVIGTDDRIYLLSNEHQSIFVWNARRQRFETSIGLRGTPLHLAYSAKANALFTGYGDRSIHVVSPSALAPVEMPFATMAADLCGMVVAGERLVVCDSSGSWTSTHSLDLLGRVRDSRDYMYPLGDGVWNEARRRVYHFRDNWTPNDILYTQFSTDGNVQSVLDSPYHPTEGISYPIRVSAAGNYVVLGSGYVFDGDSLEHLGTLTSPMIDGTWLDGDFVTLRATGLHRQSTPLSADQLVASVDGVGRRIFTTSQGGLVLVTEVAGTTVLALFDGELQVVEPPVFSDGFD